MTGGFVRAARESDAPGLARVQVASWLHTNLLTPIEVNDDERVLAVVDLLVRARCLLTDRMSTVTDMLEAV